jgi:predicted alpha/beta-hydrolase family hydrolase
MHAVPDPATLELDTPHGLARAHVRTVPNARAALVLGHGAGGSVTAPDLTAAADVAHLEGIDVALVEQPYRVAGRRSAAPAHQLDAAWKAVLEQLRGDVLAGLEIVAGGRSAGARVACRTAQEVGAIAVLCLAFPLHPPRRRPDAERQTRLPELDAVSVPTLVVQGVRDPFGMPPAGAGRQVVEVAGDHGLKADLPAVAAAVGPWLRAVVDGHQGAGS